MFAPHYALAMPRVATVSMPLRAGADHGAEVLTELLPGDLFDLLEIAHDVAWGRSVADGVVGYVAASLLDEPTVATHRVTAVEAMLREAPDANATMLASLPMGARLTALGERGLFLLTGHGYVAGRDVAPVGDQGVEGIAAAATATMGLPARVGGRSGAGVDAAGLIFLVHDRCGLNVPRLPDLQRAAIQAGDGPVMLFEHGAAIAVDKSEAVALIDGQVRRTPISVLLDGGPLGAVLAQGSLV